MPTFAWMPEETRVISLHRHLYVGNLVQMRQGFASLSSHRGLSLEIP
jgi:hypothetical protein